MLFVTGAVQIPCKMITRQLFLRTDLPNPAKHGGAGASGRGLYSELHKDRFDRWFTRKLRISNRLWLHPKGYHEKNHYFFSEKEEAGKVTQKKILLKSMRALEFQCPLKFRCQTREYTTFVGTKQGFPTELQGFAGCLFALQRLAPRWFLGHLCIFAAKKLRKAYALRSAFFDLRV